MRAIVLLLALLWVPPADASELTGAIVPPFPDNRTSDMGSCIPAGENLCAYSIASLNERDGTVVAVIAKQFTRRINGKAIWRIIDALDAPRQPDGSLWAFEECHVDGSVDPSAIGLVTYEDKGGWLDAQDTIWAARLDIQSRTLVELNPDTVRCVLPGS